MPERIVNFSDPTDKARVLSGFRRMDGKWRVSAVRYRKRRSDAQNRYTWGVVIPYIAAGLQEAWGETLTADEVHELLKRRVPSAQGTREQKHRRSSKYVPRIVGQIIDDGIHGIHRKNSLVFCGEVGCGHSASE